MWDKNASELFLSLIWRKNFHSRRYLQAYQPGKSFVLHIPKLRDGTFSTQLFRRYERSEQALLLSMMEMVIQGVSTRKVSAITQELCGVSFVKEYGVRIMF